MKIPRSLIEKVVADDINRLVLTQVYLDTKKQHLVAADGFMLVTVPVDDTDDDESGLIDPDIIKIGREGDGSLVVTKDKVTSSHWSVEQLKLSYPDVRGVFAQCKTNVDKAIPVLTLSADRLYRLAQAVCTSSYLGIEIYLPRKTTEPVEIRAEDSDIESRGLLMPMQGSSPYDLNGLVDALKNDKPIADKDRETLKRLLGVE